MRTSIEALKEMGELEKAAKDGKTIQKFIDEVESSDESEAKREI